MNQMNMARLMKWFGFFGILGGLAYLPSRFFIRPVYDGSVEAMVGWGLDTTAITCSLFLITGMLLRQWDKVGKAGIFSYFFIFLMSSIWAGHQYGLILLAPVIHQLDPEFFAGNSVPPLSFLIPTLGNIFFKAVSFILFASLSLKYKVLPRWALIVLLLGAVADFVPMGDYIGRILSGIAFIGLGSTLWKSSTQQQKLDNTRPVVA
ncbi:MAG: hypothetical protein ACQEXQ_14845 [Bacillota bacterium]